MVEALIAAVLAVFIMAVFNAPQWAIRAGAFGGLGFMLWVLILVIEWALSMVRKP
jgi:hypothetical protein